MAKRPAGLRYIGALHALSLALAVLGANALTAPTARGQQAQAPQQQVPDSYKLNMMIRTTIIALNHANRTGNYTVLRDLATPAFQQTNNAARLAEIFAKLRKRGIDLSPILFFQPKLRRPAAVNENGLLRLTGFFETEPEQISFDMLFQPVAGDWRLFGLAVDVARPQASSSEGQPPENGDQTATEPSTTQNSAPARRAEPEPAFVPERASVPAPNRRPAAAPARPDRQAQKDAAGEDSTQAEGGDLWSTSSEEPSGQASQAEAEEETSEESGSSWNLWGN